MKVAKKKKIKKLTDKCGNEEIARFLYYQCKPNAGYYGNYYLFDGFHSMNLKISNI